MTLAETADLPAGVTKDLRKTREPIGALSDEGGFGHPRGCAGTGVAGAGAGH